MKKKIVVMAIGCLLFSILTGCAASESALKTVTEKAKKLQQKMSDALASDEEPAPQKASAATACKGPVPPSRKKL